jgi:hypothetical protein
MKGLILHHFDYYWANDRLRTLGKEYWKEEPEEMI